VDSDLCAVESPTDTRPEFGAGTASPAPQPPQQWVRAAQRPRQEVATDGVSVAASVVGLLDLVPVAVVLGSSAWSGLASDRTEVDGLAALGLVLAGVWTLVAGCAVLGAGSSYTSFSYRCVVDRSTSPSEASRSWSGRTPPRSSTVPSTWGRPRWSRRWGSRRSSDGRATFTVEEDAVTVDVGRTMLVGYASVHLMAVDGETVRFAVVFSPAVVSADDVEAWISWELGIDREQAHCPSDLVAEVGALITCSADST
jgi:hypothetical protein